MAYQFNLEQPTNIAFGPSAINRLNDFLSPDSSVALVCGSSTLFSNGSVQRVIDLVDGTVTSIQIGSHEPTLESVDDLTKRLCQSSYDFVIALGGGSTLDSVKASSVLATQDPPSNSLAYLEGIGTGRRLSKPGLSTILIPTTAGTGTEVTKNAVIYSPEHGVKKSLRSRLLLADAVIIDPTLQTSCSQRVTLHSGMDAITQCFESYISVRNGIYPRTRQARFPTRPFQYRSSREPPERLERPHSNGSLRIQFRYCPRQRRTGSGTRNFLSVKCDGEP